MKSGKFQQLNTAEEESITENRENVPDSQIR